MTGKAPHGPVDLAIALVASVFLTRRLCHVEQESHGEQGAGVGATDAAPTKSPKKTPRTYATALADQVLADASRHVAEVRSLYSVCVRVDACIHGRLKISLDTPLCNHTSL